MCSNQKGSEHETLYRQQLVDHGPNVVAATVLQVQFVAAINLHPNIGVATATMVEQKLSEHVSMVMNKRYEF
jgi:hypothetical protein